MGLEEVNIENEPEELRPHNFANYKAELGRLSMDRHYSKIDEFDNAGTAKERLKEALQNGKKFVFLYNPIPTKVVVFEYINLQGN